MKQEQISSGLEEKVTSSSPVPVISPEPAIKTDFPETVAQVGEIRCPETEYPEDLNPKLSQLLPRWR